MLEGLGTYCVEALEKHGCPSETREQSHQCPIGLADRTVASTAGPQPARAPGRETPAEYAGGRIVCVDGQMAHDALRLQISAARWRSASGVLG